MKRIRDIKDIFTIFHDGIIEETDIQKDKIKLKIGIQYIAELIDNSFEFLILVLKNVKNVTFEPWTEDSQVISNWKEIFEMEIGIINTEIDNSNRIIIHSSCLNPPEDKFEGGRLIIECSDYDLFDELENKLAIKKLKDLSSYYWNHKFGKK